MTKNIIANFIGKIFASLSIFFIPLYISCLGFESYSIISFTIIISSLLIILDSGLTSTLSREFSRKDISHWKKLTKLNISNPNLNFTKLII